MTLMNQLNQHWQRYKNPMLSSDTTKQDWSRVVLYNPHVIHHAGAYRMWYVGTDTWSRSTDCALGYAESADGVHWTPHAANPILTGQDVGWGPEIHTPHVLFDADEQIYKLWFVCTTDVERDTSGIPSEWTQRLGYATSPDGLHWRVHPTPIYESGRRPCVLKEGRGRYRMWMCSRPTKQHPAGDMYKNIYHFTSPDGLHWERGAQPVIQATGAAATCVYPFVLQEEDDYHMWYGGHIAGTGRFEIFYARSADGLHWETHHDAPVFGAADDQSRFDARYVSTPCVLREPGQYLMYYSARDRHNEYRDGDGNVRTDLSGVYRHIGLAVWSPGN